MKAAYNALGNQVARRYYDIMGSCLYEANMEGEVYWRLADASGAEWLRWTNDGSRVERNKLSRFVSSWLMGSPDDTEKLFIHKEYGEGQANDTSRNLRGKLYRTCGQSGICTHSLYDFQGNSVRQETQFANSYNALLDWSTGQASLDRVALEIYVDTGHFDTFGRENKTTACNEYISECTYNHTGCLTSLHLANPIDPKLWESYIVDVLYNEILQSEHITYGNVIQKKNQARLTG